MLRLFDLQANELADVTPDSGRRLRVYVAGPPPDRGLRLGDLRPYLVADLIRRTAQRHRLAVVACEDDPAPAIDSPTARQRSDAFRADCVALNIHPPEYAAPAADGVDVIIEVEGEDDPATPPAPPASHRVRSGPVLFEGGELPSGAAAVAGMRRRGLDPLAGRLVMLERHYREQLTLSWPILIAADEVLRNLRGRMARWASHPSKPMRTEYVADISGAFDDDLNSPAALAALRTMADDEQIDAGSKFETVAHADQWLGLDLASEVGRSPG